MVQVKSVKSKGVEESGGLSSTLAQTIDDFAVAQAALAEADAVYKPIKAAFDKVRKDLELQLDDEVGTESKGSLFTDATAFEYGPRGEKVMEMDKLGILELLGSKTFVRLASIPIGKLRAALTPEEVEEVVTTEKAGARRTLKTTPR